MDEFMVKTCNFCAKTMKATLFSVHVKNAHNEDENNLEDLQPKKRKPGPASRTGRKKHIKSDNSMENVIDIVGQLSDILTESVAGDTTEKSKVGDFFDESKDVYTTEKSKEEDAIEKSKVVDTIENSKVGDTTEKFKVGDNIEMLEERETIEMS